MHASMGANLIGNRTPGSILSSKVEDGHGGDDIIAQAAERTHLYRRLASLVYYAFASMGAQYFVKVGAMFQVWEWSLGSSSLPS